MGRDKELVTLFVEGHNANLGSTYRIEVWPDKVERRLPAVEAIAIDDEGRRLAIEHTLLEPFPGEKEDAVRLEATFGCLEYDSSLVAPEYDVTVWVPVGAIQKGVDWKDVGVRVHGWFREARDRIPEGASNHTIPGLPFNLTVSVHKMYIPGYPGNVSVGRSAPDAFREVVKRALSRKLPKLVSTNADKRVLLLEKGSAPRGYGEIASLLDSMRTDFNELGQVDEIWVVNTVSWTSEKILWFLRVWPNGVHARFAVHC